MLQNTYLRISINEPSTKNHLHINVNITMIIIQLSVSAKSEANGVHVVISQKYA